MLLVKNKFLTRLPGLDTEITNICAKYKNFRNSRPQNDRIFFFIKQNGDPAPSVDRKL